ncbi:hypothetical protein J0X19_00225 [Hymenobacter sp. BT186]|uniref:Uncharacterized protein n=1 Tax=Hymenobacter telluris TaxID=2816474 RepID=A0A939ES62_9BACT|nr:hypothetical protein [Hymenobacter telluris]MBO0356356.1 hypothetical protein [Hymenobacter telluris]MBW3372380.1 hypothetical protein [Hymenobacter norwichensis]
MKAELIPVIEVDLRHPEVAEALASISPFAVNTPFYRITDIPLGAIKALAKAHLQGYFDGERIIEEQCSFFGGYVLRIDGQNTLFPQCCGELSDIVYWKHVAKYNRGAYCNGHPAPEVLFTTDMVLFDCRVDYEEFRPYTPLEIQVAKSALSAAYDQALLELEVFARQLEQIQLELPTPVESIAHVLIYRNAELSEQ